jgi:hypothetical protein
MKNKFLIILITLSVFSCKKEQVYSDSLGNIINVETQKNDIRYKIQGTYALNCFFSFTLIIKNTLPINKFMFPKINPTSTKAWNELKLHFEEMKDVHMKNLFAKDINRFDTYSIKTDQLLFDFSKNIITEKTLQLLQQLAIECNLPEHVFDRFIFIVFFNMLSLLLLQLLSL